MKSCPICMAFLAGPLFEDPTINAAASTCAMLGHYRYGVQTCVAALCAAHREVFFNYPANAEHRDALASELS
jgi:hypothetical protein